VGVGGEVPATHPVWNWEPFWRWYVEKIPSIRRIEIRTFISCLRYSSLYFNVLNDNIWNCASLFLLNF
jgi:hypothetical protein